jgi:hypothetical protein
MRFQLLLMTSFTAILAGCGSSGPTLYPVQGKVTFNGKPLNTGSVLFVPLSKGPSAYGVIAEDGTYRLTTDDREGALPGKHRVMINAVKDNGINSPHSYLIPAKYGSDSSGLEAEVKEQDENTIDFALEGKSPSEKAPVALP